MAPSCVSGAGQNLETLAVVGIDEAVALSEGVRAEAVDSKVGVVVERCRLVGAGQLETTSEVEHLDVPRSPPKG